MQSNIGKLINFDMKCSPQKTCNAESAWQLIDYNAYKFGKSDTVAQ